MDLKTAYKVLTIVGCVLCSSLMICFGNSSQTDHFSAKSLPTEELPLNNINLTVTVDSDSILNTVSDKFVSFAVDSSLLARHLKDFSVCSSTRFQNLAKALSPAYFRFGGHASDLLYFKVGTRNDIIMEEDHFDTICEFVESVGWEFIFTLNLQQRKNGSWDPTNAESLLRYAASKNCTPHLQLGNEPDVYYRENFTVIDPAQIGRDFGTLRQLMNLIPEFNNCLLLGGDFAGSFYDEFCQRFLSTGSQHIDALSIHHYYMNGKAVNSTDAFLSPDVLLNFKQTAERTILDLLTVPNGTQMLWLGETGSAWDSGAPIYSESFISGFVWLDKLGMAGVLGVRVVTRQSLIGGHYCLIQDEEPLPDYWLTLLYKRLVGKKVLKVTSSEHNNYFRIYAHCSANDTKGVTIYYQNMYSSVVNLNIPQYSGVTYDLYTLTAGDNGFLTSKKMMLNGDELRMNGDSLPPIEPIKASKWPVKVPKHSFGFLVFPHADAAACV